MTCFNLITQHFKQQIWQVRNIHEQSTSGETINWWTVTDVLLQVTRLNFDHWRRSEAGNITTSDIKMHGRWHPSNKKTLQQIKQKQKKQQQRSQIYTAT